MDSLARASVAMQLEGLLIEQILRPLESSVGEVGALPLNLCAQAIAQRDAARFASALHFLP